MFFLQKSLGCDAGQYADEKSSKACKSCPTGKIVADKRSKSIDDCISCSDSDIPNKDQSACVNPNSVKGLGGIPISESKTEAGTLTYNVKMNGEPPSSTSLTVTASISSNDPRCKVSTGTFMFSQSNWNEEQTIEIVTNDDGLFLAKDAISYTCLITYTLTSSDITEEYTPRTLTLDVTSSGCGDGEFLGKYDRGQGQKMCICAMSFFLPSNSECTACPAKASVCDEIGVIAPKSAIGWWRANVSSSNLTEYPFYKCKPGQCKGTTNGTNTSCNPGYDENGPKCSTCASNYYMANGNCFYCESRAESSSASSQLMAIIFMCIILYLLGSCYFLSRPALSNELKEKVKRALSHTESFRLSLDANGMLDRQSFSAIMNKEDKFVLTPGESALIFDGVDTDGSGTITLEELMAFTSENQVKKPGMRDKLKRKKSEVKEKRDEMEEESGYAARDDIAEQRDLANEYADNLNGGDPNGDVNTFSLPSISLGEFPGLTLPDGVDMNFKLPSFNLGDFPGLDLIQMTLRDVGNIEFPSIELGQFPGIELPDHISGNIQLPSMNISEFPNVVLPQFKKLDGFRMSLPGIPDINMPNTNNMNMKLNIGGILMKLKLFLGFVQCVSFFPVTFG